LKASLSLILEIPITRTNIVETELRGALGCPGAKRGFLDCLMPSGCDYANRFSQSSRIKAAQILLPL
jgi:hypothetical protein